MISPGVSSGRILLDRKQASTLAERAMLRRCATFDAFDALFASRYARYHVSLDIFLRSWQRPRVRPCSRLRFKPALKVVWYPLLWLQPGLRPRRRNRHRVHHVRFLCVLHFDPEHLASLFTNIALPTKNPRKVAVTVDGRAAIETIDITNTATSTG